MSDDDSRDAIAKRRSRLIALALGGIAATTTAACSPCLSILADSGPDAGLDAGPDGGQADAQTDGAADQDASEDGG